MPLSERDILFRVASRYARWKTLYPYALGKIAFDPAYRAVRDRLIGSALPVLDIGCGVGMLGIYLRESGCRFPIKAIDVNSSKIERARAAAGERHPDIEFVSGDGSRLGGFQGNVVLLDVIHYFEDDAQRGFLERVARMIPPGGKALIRIAVRDRSLRYFITCVEEVFIRMTRWIVGGAFNFPSVDEVAEPFRRLDFDERIEPLWGRTPFNSYLFEFQRAVTNERPSNATKIPDNEC